MRIAMIGARGVPATFGGVERHVEELGARLAAKGHDVTVFARNNYGQTRAPEYRGIKVQYLPVLDTKHLEAISHAGLATLTALFEGYDLYHYHAIGPGLPAMIPRYLGRGRVVQTIHGLDSRRAKWGSFAQRVLEIGEKLSARVPHATVVVSRDLQRHYQKRHSRETYFIPNGVEPGKRRPARLISERYGLERGKYLLFVGRFVPEKAPDLLIRAFRQLTGDTRLVLAGGSSHTDAYEAELRDEAALDPRVLFTGYVYGEVLDELYSNAGAFVLPSRLEGLPLTLLEAAAFGVPLVASDIPPHVEVLEESAPGRRLFGVGDEAALIRGLRQILDEGEDGRRAAVAFGKGVMSRHRWDVATAAIEDVYTRVLAL